MQSFDAEDVASVDVETWKLRSKAYAALKTELFEG
jgi:hypothetical protein